MNIDKNSLHQEINALAKTTLKVVSASSLKLFSLEAKNLSKKAVRSAIDREYNMISSKLEGEDLSRFLDLNSGYMVSMNSWVNNTEFIFPSIPVPEEPDEINASTNSLREIVKRKEVQTFGVGTAISIILFFSGVKIIALVTEAIATAASLYLYNQSNREKVEINNKAKEEFEQDVNKYISNVIEASLSWVNYAEKKSNELIASFK